MKLNKEENKILKDVEKGDWKSVKNIEIEKAKYKLFAKATFLKDRRINIRISKRDLEEIQKRAIQEGLPYQTLISSILHKYISGRLIDRKILK